MIYDRLTRLDRYRSLDANLARAIDFVLRPDTRTLPLGRHEVAGDDVFAILQTYETKPVDVARYEAHRKYVDIQVILDGREAMDVADVAELSVATPHDDATDVSFFESPASAHRLTVSVGEFAIFLPHDAHRPCVAVGKPAPVLKLVMKIRAW